MTNYCSHSFVNYCIALVDSNRNSAIQIKYYYYHHNLLIMIIIVYALCKHFNTRCNFFSLFYPSFYFRSPFASPSLYNNNDFVNLHGNTCTWHACSYSQGVLFAKAKQSSSSYTFVTLTLFRNREIFGLNEKQICISKRILK